MPREQSAGGRRQGGRTLRLAPIPREVSSGLPLVLVVVLVVVVELLAFPLDEDSTTRTTTTTPSIPGCIQEAPDSGADAPPGRVARVSASDEPH
ncbi:MAG: hypothetical protein FJ290_08625 [Planctomycetes bacterium]|nr:hypothetical protein [Planctomycetota bacterium]